MRTLALCLVLLAAALAGCSDDAPEPTPTTSTPAPTGTSGPTPGTQTPTTTGPGPAPGASEQELSISLSFTQINIQGGSSNSGTNCMGIDLSDIGILGGNVTAEWGSTAASGDQMVIEYHVTDGDAPATSEPQASPLTTSFGPVTGSDMLIALGAPMNSGHVDVQGTMSVTLTYTGETPTARELSCAIAG